MKTLFLIIALTLVTSPAFSKIPGELKKCKMCHTFEEGGKIKMGPNLFGVMDRQAGTSEGFEKYKALKDVDFIWNDEKMTGWLKNSKLWAKANLSKKTIMAVKIKEKQREKIIEFLNTLK